jgi:hypothetical protein
MLSVIAIVNGLRKREGGFYIYISGTDILLDSGYEIQSTLNWIYLINN